MQCSPVDPGPAGRHDSHYSPAGRAERENFTVLKPEQTETPDDKRLTTVVYSGGRDSGKFCYRFTSIRFDDKPGMAIVVLQVALPSLWPDQESVLDGITKSARLRVNPPGKPGVEAE